MLLFVEVRVLTPAFYIVQSLKLPGEKRQERTELRQLAAMVYMILCVDAGEVERELSPKN